MFRHLLIATDGSELANRAVEHGLGLARALGAEVTALTVVEPFPSTAHVMMPSADDVRRYEIGATADAERLLGLVSDRAREMGVTCSTRHVGSDRPADAILETSRDIGCDAIVMATHGRRGLDRLLVGSQAARVMSRSRVPVLVCR